MNKTDIKAKFRFSINHIIALAILLLLYHTSTYNYLLFHSLSEFFSIIIACMIFMIGWHSRYYLKNNYLMYISISYIFIGFLDLLHTISYPGMNIFKDYDYYANQIWIGSRYLEAFALLSGFIFIGNKRKFNHKVVLTIMGFITFLIVMSIFVWKIFPVCFVEGVGLTAFKKNSEYIICLMLLTTSYLLYRNKNIFAHKVYVYMIYSIFFTIIAELAFTFYISNYGISNLAGHFFKLFSFYCIYKSIIVTGLESPQETIFKELVDKERRLINANQTKDQLYSILMHDIRGPINSLHTFMHDASTNFDSYSEKELKTFLEAGHLSVGSINTLINNLNVWIKAQSESIEPKYTEANIKNLIEEAMEPLLGAAQSKNIIINNEANIDLKANTDIDILKTVLRNLVNNSIKFTNNNGKITINTDKSDKNVIIIVQDNGVGISRHILKNIFDVNKQFTSKGTNGEHGSGLGLKVCKDLLEKINGSIHIHSEFNKGTTTTVILK